MGIRKKIMLGFTLLGLLLFFSGLVSYFELSRLSRTAQASIDASHRTMLLSRDMLDAVQDQNTALLQMLMLGDPTLDTVISNRQSRFTGALDEAMTLVNDPHVFDSVRAADFRYHHTVHERLNSPFSELQDTEWFLQVYSIPYYDLTSSIKDVMVATQSRMDSRTVQLEHNAYRAIMPGVIALVIAILIILMFFYFMDIYYIRPVLKIDAALGKYLLHKVPFKVTMEGRDEVYALKEKIDTLVDMTGQVNKTPNNRDTSR